MADDSIKLLEERLTRLEAALAQRPTGPGGFVPPGGAVVDPAPWGAGWGRPFPSPVVDPAPWWPGGWGPPRWPTHVVDPAPSWPNHIVDPAPAGGGFTRQAASAMALGRVGHVGDPAPFDFSRLSISQLESTLHTINAERARLDAMEMTVKQQLERTKQQGKG